MRRPRLNSLRTFEAAGRHLSFARAASELNISPPAVSQQVRQLEGYLDAKLFVRRHRQLSLSGTGQAYYDAVHEALERLDAVTDQLFPDRREKTVTIRCTPSVATLWLMPRLGAFNKSHPDIDLSIRTLDQDTGGPGSTGADLEIAIGEADEDDAQVFALFTAEISPVCAPTLMAKNSATKEPGDMALAELIHVLGYDDDWHRWFRRYVPDHGPVLRGLSVDGSLIAIEAAQRGDGVMLGRRPFIDPYLRSGELVDVFDGTCSLHAGYYVRQLRPVRPASPGDDVTNWLLAQASESSDQTGQGR